MLKVRRQNLFALAVLIILNNNEVRNWFFILFQNFNWFKMHLFVEIFCNVFCNLGNVVCIGRVQAVVRANTGGILRRLGQYFSVVGIADVENTVFIQTLNAFQISLVVFRDAGVCVGASQVNEVFVLRIFRVLHVFQRIKGIGLVVHFKV